MTFKVWDVKAVEDNDEDVSYGTDCLKLHMDEPYYDGHPGINFLHCIRCSMLVLMFVSSFNKFTHHRNDDCVQGGENVLLDAFPVVEEFKTRHPQHFKTLTRIPSTFQRIWKSG